ncbi:hypothetical protein M3Y96_00181200 [Aphelenchoides besseyi]|nr:hypothetical protein M3Y96_00181200 [Aphelenchoides besseyi]
MFFNRFFCMSLFTSTLLKSSIIAKASVYKIYTDSYMSIKLSIGSPRQSFDAIIDFATVPILVSSEACGIRRSDCPRYCLNEVFSRLYCIPLCQPIASILRHAYCTTPFISSNSTSYVPSDDPWSEMLQCCRNKFYGHFAKETMRIGKDSATVPAFELEYVEAMLIQINGMVGYMAIVGVGLSDWTGRVGFVQQLKKRGEIPEAILTFNSLKETMTVGELDQQFCNSWNHFPVVEKETTWTFTVEKLQVYGVEFRNQRVTFGKYDLDLLIPQEALKVLIEKGVVLSGCVYFATDICVDIAANSTIRLSNKDQEVEIPIDAIKDDKYTCRRTAENRTFCDSYARVSQYSKMFCFRL